MAAAPEMVLPVAPIDLRTETLIGLAAAARRLPPGRNDRPVSPSTIWRWIGQGVRRTDGAAVRLGAVRVGGRWVTSEEALGRFTAALTADRRPAPAPTPAARSAAADRAGRELDRLGM